MIFRANLTFDGKGSMRGLQCLLSSEKLNLLVDTHHMVNVQSFIDDPDSLRRKRQKFNNSPNALVLRHVQAEAEKREYFSKTVLNSTALPGVGLIGVIDVIASSESIKVHCAILLLSDRWLFFSVYYN